MEVTYTASVGHIRVHDRGNYENKDPFVGVVTVHHLSDSIVYLEANLGRFDKTTYVEIYRKLSEMGVQTIWYQRHNKLVCRQAKKTEKW